MHYKNNKYTAFLQWALPQMEMRWKGFRKVRRQVIRRIQGRIRDLELNNIDEYRQYILENEDEWVTLDSFCRITISRFYRDKKVFEILKNNALIYLADLLIEKNRNKLKCMSIGCASGEEIYTLKIIWETFLKNLYGGVELSITAVDIDSQMLKRVEIGEYNQGCIKNLPRELINECFIQSGSLFHLEEKYKKNIQLLSMDIRHEIPDGYFDLIFCRNLIFTYFNQSLQKIILKNIKKHLSPGGLLIIGNHETIPPGNDDLKLFNGNKMIYIFTVSYTHLRAHET